MELFNQYKYICHSSELNSSIIIDSQERSMSKFYLFTSAAIHLDDNVIIC